MTACGGGGRSPLWRQMLADLYGCEVRTSKASDEGPALGAAILAGVGCGVYDGVQSACAQIVRPDTTTAPDAAAHAQYEPYYQVFCAAYPALKEIFASLFSL